MAQDLTQWRKDTLTPALGKRLDSAFPEFGFRHSGGAWWIASKEPSGAEGYGAKEGRLTASGFGFRSFKTGKPPVSWADYLEGKGLAFPENLRELARLSGVDFPEREWTPEQKEEHGKKETQRRLLRDFMALAKENLLGPNGEPARAFLLARGFKVEDLDRLELGLCPSMTEAEKALTPKGHGVEPLRRLLHDSRWLGRLVGSIRDPWGEVANLWARDLSGKSEQGEKYLYLSNDAALTRKGELVPFGLGEALQHGGKENLLLVEGVLDALHLQARGVVTVAALGGAGDQLTPDLLERLSHHKVKAVSLLMDNDEGGSLGLKKAMENLAKAHQDGRLTPELWVVDPAGMAPQKDPDAFLKAHGEDPAKLLDLVDRRTSSPLFRAHAFLDGITPESPEAKRKGAASKVVEFANGLRGRRAELDREDLFRLVAGATGYTFEALALMAEHLEEVRVSRHEAQTLKDLLSQAREDHQDGANARKVAQDLRRGLDRLHTIEEPPPLFSVDRLTTETENTLEGRPSGWTSLDEPESKGGLGLRFNPGELALFGARTGHGKTSAMVGLAFNWAEAGERLGQDERLVFYSSEEPEVRIFHRLLALMTQREAGEDRALRANEVRDFLRLGLHKKAGNPSGDLLRKALDRLRSWEERLLVVYRPAWTVEAIVAHAQALAERETVGAVLVDYLQRIPCPEGGRYDRRDQEVSAVARGLKSLAVDLSAPVVTGAQINRTNAKTVGQGSEKKMEDHLKEFVEGRPELHLIREGGAEQEVDLALGLLNLRADWGGKTPAPEVTPFEVGLLKSRYGSVGKWKPLAFVGKLHLLRDAKDGEFRG
jgi:DNA primase/replicative DNA helicase